MYDLLKQLDEEIVGGSNIATKTATQIAQQLVSTAMYQAHKGGGRDAQQLAYELADRFHSMVTQEIDQEFKFTTMKNVGPE